ncbi:multiple sugar transport system substrate-binding protein [Paenibacillus catalpae]|uniref:Multiple sugar transport system substrate-binding protein n=1 Tax=Paenibacillus catalpae TaxID=1045775 RepID=A0A1I2DE53_9BACL|nr:sugar ABC transporter substrate-binding protein [Paenibacillus catalpae]SFE78875.1 multiple sugar transport system substrate-binding protein [Paenibacillus catalpae]
MKKSLKLAMTGSLLVGLLAGCGSNGETAGEKNTTSSGEEAAPVHLKATVLPDDLETFKTAYAEFSKENPNIEVEFETIPQKQYYEKLRMQLSSGNDIDLFGGNMDVFLDTGVLEPLDDSIKNAGVDVSGYGPLYDSLKVNGKVYGLPYRKSNWMLYYNKNLFDQAGVPYPSDDMTWNEFRDLAKKMTKGEGVDKIYGAFLQPWAQTWYMQGVQTGASIIDKDLSTFKAGLQFRLDMEKDGSMMGWAEQITTSAHYNSAFQKGNVAMNLIGDWHVAQLRQAEAEKKINFDWDVVPVPHPDGVAVNTSLATPVSLMVNSKSKHKEEAFKVIEFMSGAKGAKQFAAKGFLTGYMNDDIRKTYIGDGSLKPKNIHYFVEQKEYPEYPLLPGVKNILVQSIYMQEGELALTGAETVDQAIDKIGERVASEWAEKYANDYKAGK